MLAPVWPVCIDCQRESRPADVQGCALQQGEMPLGLPVARPGDELCMDHFPLTALALDAKVRFRQHLAQSLKATCQRVGRDFEEKSVVRSRVLALT